MSELRDLVFRLSLVAGLGGALLWGLHHPPEATRCPTHAHGGTKVLSQCATQSLNDVILRWGIIIAVGMVAGCLVGVLLARLVPGPRGTARTRA